MSDDEPQVAPIGSQRWRAHELRLVRSGGRTPIRPPIEAAQASTWTVVGFGDSLVWGQGLKRGTTILDEIARLLKPSGVAPTRVENCAQSGSVLAQTDKDARVRYAGMFGWLFPDAGGRQVFVGGGHLPILPDQELPSSFPTIMQQIEAFPTDANGVAAGVDLVVVNGGVNDLGVVDLLANDGVENKDFFRHFEPKVKEAFYTQTMCRLQEIRTKFPNATVLLLAYPPAFTRASRQGPLIDFIKHQQEFGWFKSTFGTPLGTRSAAKDLRTRAEWAADWALHWQKRAVVEVNEEADRRVIFVPSRVRRTQAVFSSKAQQRLYHEDFTWPTTDALRHRRRAASRRVSLLARLRKAERRLSLEPPASVAVPASMARLARDPLMADFPAFHDLLSRWKAAPNSRSKRRDLRSIVGADVERLKLGLMASFAHLNAAGAARMAEGAHRRHVDRESELRRIVKAGGAAAYAQQLGMPSAAAATPNALAEHRRVDAIMVKITTGRNGTTFGHPVSIEIHRSDLKRPTRLPLTVNYPHPRYRWRADLDPGTTTEFAVDTRGGIRWDTITQIDLVAGKSNDLPPAHRLFELATVDIEFNGVPVKQIVSTRKIRPGKRVRIF